MFSPKYSITHKILDSIVKTELDLFYLKSVEVPVEWVNRLKVEAMIRKVLGGASLCDVRMSLDLVSKIVMDEPDRDEKTVSIADRLGISIRERDLQLVLNLINTNKLVDQIGYISSKFAHERVLMKEMLQINKLVNERLVPVEMTGIFRSSDLKSEKNGLHPLVNEVTYQMEDFMSWFENSSNSHIHPLVKFSVSMVELLRIAPFEHYNTITTMYFSLAFLGSVGYGLTYTSIEDELSRNQEKIYEVLVKCEENDWDCTLAVEYFVGILQACVSKAKVRVANIEGMSVKYRSGGGRAVALSERQLAIMEEITVRNEMTIKQIREVTPLVSDDTILRDLKDLVSKKMIRKRGKTKGAVYVLGKVKSFS